MTEREHHPDDREGAFARPPEPSAKRRAREAEALRANLLRRKAQQRARQAASPSLTTAVTAPGETSEESPLLSPQRG
ncbi:hypothetical protein [Granulibacter bethesdensis]|uniref:hypothetical protein n=1 Tax=Granulibacter bethesdensis TaxID=364410 RepID=UPI00046D78BE|nr:hypothetical protein [Granulibacter bethesdensis]